jgi:hypothetical protein
VTQPNSPNDDDIDDLEQKPVDGAEAENVKGGVGATDPTLIRVPGPSPRKIAPCWVEPCV